MTLNSDNYIDKIHEAIGRLEASKAALLDLSSKLYTLSRPFPREWRRLFLEADIHARKAAEITTQASRWGQE